MMCVCVCSVRSSVGVGVISVIRGSSRQDRKRGGKEGRLEVQGGGGKGDKK